MYFLRGGLPTLRLKKFLTHFYPYPTLQQNMKYHLYQSYLQVGPSCSWNFFYWVFQKATCPLPECRGPRDKNQKSDFFIFMLDT